ncbi:MAG: phosphoglycerate dehydrogenase [bacterium]|nr:phosphoglycerate dehydrogenase [bacterium]
MKVLISDPLAEEGIKILKKSKDILVDVKTDLTPDKLLNIIGNYDALIVRSSTKVSKKVITAGINLKVIGRAGVSLDNIDTEEATKRGIVVMNTPLGNTISTAEHTMALILSLSRNIVPANISLQNNQWNCKAFKGVELDQKILGIIGLGRIGSELAKKALAFNMKIIAYDPYASKNYAQRYMVKLVNLKELLSISDYISLHLPLTSDTKHIISTKEFKIMKKGVRIINCARGGLINEQALLKAINDKVVAGCALDVFENEPPFDNPLIKLNNCVAVPHLGASTKEAQTKVAIAIAHQMVAALLNNEFNNAVNIPQIDPTTYQYIKDYLPLVEKLGSMHAQLCEGSLEEVKIDYQGRVALYNTTPLTSAILKGIFGVIVSGPMVNYVNAPIIAQERGIKVTEIKNTKEKIFSNLISLSIRTSKEEHSISGSLFEKKEPWIVFIDNYRVDALPKGYVLVITNHDKPGVIGKVGTILGKNNINIGNLKLGRNIIGGVALSVWNIDINASKNVIKEILKLNEIIDVKQVNL